MKNYDYVWSDDSQMSIPVRNDNPDKARRMVGRRATGGNMSNWNNDFDKKFDRDFDRLEKASDRVFKFVGAWVAFCVTAGVAMTVAVIWLLVVLIKHFS